MNLTKTTNLIGKHEGVRTWAYLDTKGIWTTGIGFNLERQGANQALQAHGIDSTPIWTAINAAKAIGAHQTGNVVTIAQAQSLAADDIQASIKDLRTFVTGFDGMPDDAQMVLIDLHFNMGGATLRTFHHTLAHFVAHDWKGAAQELSNSHPWVDQVGARATEDCNILKAIV